MKRNPKRSRRRRRSPDGGPDALVPISLDIPVWLLDRLEDDAEASGYSRALIASEWLEEAARRTPKKVVRGR